MYSFASGTILSAGTCSPSIPGTHPVSLNISLASSRRAIQSLVITLLMIYLSGVGDRGSCDRRSPNGIYGILDRVTASVRLDVEGPDDVAPLLGFLGDEPAKVCGRDDKRRHTQNGEPRFYLGIGEARVDLLVELLDDLGRRGLRCADAGPGARLVARHKFPDSRDIGQHLRTRCGGHCQRAQLA